MSTAKELLDLIAQKDQEIAKAAQERDQAFEQLSKEHGKQFDVDGKTKLVVRRVSRTGGRPVTYHFRTLGKGAVKIEDGQK